MLATAPRQEEALTEKVSGPCQCTDLLTMTPNEDEMAGLKVKSHLESLMGTDIIKLNDREYMLALQNKLMKEYDTVMDRKEEQRSEKERRRQRRLYIEGLQDMPNIDQKSARARSSAQAGSIKSSTGRGTDRGSAALTCAGSDEEECMNPTVGLSSNPERRKHRQTKNRRSSKVMFNEKQDQRSSSEFLSSGGSFSDEPRATQAKYPGISEEDINTQRETLMRQLRRESTVTGMYKTADLVLAAPVAEISADRPVTVAGSPRGSTDSKPPTSSNR